MDLQLLGELFEEGLGGDRDVGAGDSLLAVARGAVILDLDLRPRPGLVKGAEVRLQGGEVVGGEAPALVIGEIVEDFRWDLGEAVRKRGNGVVGGDEGVPAGGGAGFGENG